MKYAWKTTIFGFGAMGRALAMGWISSKIIPKKFITAIDVNKSKLKNAIALGIKASSNSSLALKNTKLILLSVKPQQMKELMSKVGCLFPKKALVVSIAAGISTAQIEKALPQGCPVVRVMPNTPALLGAGMSAITAGNRAKQSHVKLVLSLFSVVGKTVIIKENHMDLVTALSGSGPAYFFHLAEVLTNVGEKKGLNPKIALYLISQTIYGAARMILDSDKKPEELRMQVTSPGGTTQAALSKMDEMHFDEILHAAIDAAIQRSEELRQEDR